MNKADFLSRVFANPDDDGADLLESAKHDPRRQQILREVREFDTLLRTALRDVPLPESLNERLKSAVLGDTSILTPRIPAWRSRRHWALAASVVLAVSIGFSSLLNPASGPSAEELAFGEEVLAHVYQELAQYDNPGNVNFQVVNQVMASAGSQLLDNAATRDLPISFAKPCYIFGQQPSAHLVIRGENGLINVIVINNSPVSQTFTVNDEQFTGTVMPLESGNLILVGDQQEGLDTYLRLLSDNVEWVI
ncbi:MAG: hypothetical protein RLZZ385_1701 [Pseudomonadota bacterium]|jgi:hypothetical protein